MVLSEQAIRKWKLATAILTTFTAVHTTLYTHYDMPPHLNGQKHVFTDLQTIYHDWIHATFWNLPTSIDSSERNEPPKQDHSEPSSSSPSSSSS